MPDAEKRERRENRRSFWRRVAIRLLDLAVAVAGRKRDGSRRGN
jgi:hypothetical protein